MASESTEHAVRELAYVKWEQAGRPAGDGIGFWLEAEHEICQTAVASSPVPSTRETQAEASSAPGALKLAKASGGARRRAS